MLFHMLEKQINVFFNTRKKETKDSDWDIKPLSTKQDTEKTKQVKANFSTMTITQNLNFSNPQQSSFQSVLQEGGCV